MIITTKAFVFVGYILVEAAMWNTGLDIWVKTSYHVVSLIMEYL
jgi:hypothetical protein